MEVVFADLAEEPAAGRLPQLKGLMAEEDAVVQKVHHHCYVYVNEHAFVADNQLFESLTVHTPFGEIHVYVTDFETCDFCNQNVVILNIVFF